MRIKQLQRLNDNDEWVSDAYVYENETGQLVFRYNVLTWGRVGSNLNGQLQKAGTSLDDVETIIKASKRQRWLPIEVLEGTLEECLIRQDEVCGIPQSKQRIVNAVT